MPQAAAKPSKDAKPLRLPRMAREPKVAVTVKEVITTETAIPDTAQTKRMTKSELLLGLLRREEGATLEQMVGATGWLPHTTRAALSGLKKKGHEVTSVKVDGVRTYRIADGGSGS